MRSRQGFPKVKLFGRPGRSAGGPTIDLVAWRNAAARWTALVIVGVFALMLGSMANRSMLMPGPLAAAHGSLGDCQGCHADVGKGNFGWVRTIFFAGSDPHKDSKACMTCHKIPRDPLNPHGVDDKTLANRTDVLRAAIKQDEPALDRAHAQLSFHRIVFDVGGRVLRHLPRRAPGPERQPEGRRRYPLPGLPCRPVRRLRERSSALSQLSLPSAYTHSVRPHPALRQELRRRRLAQAQYRQGPRTVHRLSCADPGQVAHGSQAVRPDLRLVPPAPDPG